MSELIGPTKTQEMPVGDLVQLHIGRVGGGPSTSSALQRANVHIGSEYQFRCTDGSFGAAFRRVASEELKAAIAGIDDTGLDSHSKLHRVRKRCKRLRSLMRLVRPRYAAYDLEYTEIGNAARRFSPFRDATARIEAFDRLRTEYRSSSLLPIVAPLQGVTNGKRRRGKSR